MPGTLLPGERDHGPQTVLEFGGNVDYAESVASLFQVAHLQSMKGRSCGSDFFCSRLDSLIRLNRTKVEVPPMFGVDVKRMVGFISYWHETEDLYDIDPVRLKTQLYGKPPSQLDLAEQDLKQY